MIYGCNTIMLGAILVCCFEDLTLKCVAGLVGIYRHSLILYMRFTVLTFLFISSSLKGHLIAPFLATVCYIYIPVY